MRLLVADKFPDSGLAYLREQGHDVTYLPDTSAGDLGNAVDGNEILVVRSTEVDAAAIERAPDLALIVRAGAGTNTIDREAAAARAIHVSNVPGRNAIAVAELTMGLILAIDRRIPDNVSDLRASEWNKSAYSKGLGLMGRSLGIIGLGAIGMAVASRAASFGLRLHALAKSRSQATEEAMAELEFTIHDDIETLAAATDIITLHVPATSDTSGLVDTRFLAARKPGTVLINTSRADVVDEAALLAVIDDKDLWVGVDVFADEPGSGTDQIHSQLAGHHRVYGTHHIGASTAQAQAAVAAGVLEVIDAFAGGEIVNCVNLQPHVPDTTRITVRHVDQVGVLASMLMLIRDAGINVEHMSNLVFQGAEAASATLDLKGKVTDDLLERLMEIPEIIHARFNT
ncbi:MAG: NAD(P)-dependent oxidoreductase [Acidimicrobiia bacterium]